MCSDIASVSLRHAPEIVVYYKRNVGQELALYSWEILGYVIVCYPRKGGGAISSFGILGGYRETTTIYA